MSDPAQSFLDALHGWLVLIPLALLCAPPGYSFFDGAPDTVSIGVALSALGVLPALIMTLVRGRGVAAGSVAPLWITLITGAIALPGAADSFGAWRALVGLAAALGFVLSAASLRPSGRRVVQGGLGVVALMLLLAAPMGPAWTGALGNTGDLSEAALPCAILGAGVFLTAQGPIAFGGFAAILLYAVYAGYAPVYAGLASLLVATVVAAIGMIAGRHGGEAGRQGAAKRLRILLVALLVGLLPVGYRAWVAPADEASQESSAGASTADQDKDLTASAAELAETQPGATTGGFAFRRLTWERVPRMIQDHLKSGVGPGQFQAAFPPYRSQEEILLSSFNRLEPTPNEVEHAHNDWLTAVAEHGPVGGGAFVLFLLIVAVRALRATWGPDRSRRDFGFAAIAVLVNAAVNAPLLYGPAAPAIAFTIFGVLLGRSEKNPDGPETSDAPGASVLARTAPYLLPGIAFLALGLLSPRALSLFEYGRALCDTPSARVVTEDGREVLDPGRLGVILDAALGAEPSSPVALEKKAQLLSRTGAAPDSRRDVVLAWTQARPMGLASNIALGVLNAQGGDFEAALQAFDQARAVDPTHPIVLENRLRAACDLRNAELAEQALSEFDASGHLGPDKLRSLSIEQLLTGRLEVAAPLVKSFSSQADQKPGPGNAAEGSIQRAALAERTVDALDANATYAARKRAKGQDDELLADAYNVAFQMLTALDFLERGFPSQAAISAHQALQSARGRGLDIGPIRLRKAAAKAAASLADGNADSSVGEALRAEAEAILGEAPIRSQDRAALAPIEREALRRAGLLEGPEPTPPK